MYKVHSHAQQCIETKYLYDHIIGECLKLCRNTAIQKTPGTASKRISLGLKAYLPSKQKQQVALAPLCRPSQRIIVAFASKPQEMPVVWGVHNMQLEKVSPGRYLYILHGQWACELTGGNASSTRRRQGIVCIRRSPSNSQKLSAAHCGKPAAKHIDLRQMLKVHMLLADLIIDHLSVTLRDVIPTRS